MKESRISLRTKLAIIAVFIAAALFGIFIGSPAQRYKASEEEACRDRCAKVKMSGSLISQNPVGPLTKGGYDGPWKCECR